MPTRGRFVCHVHCLLHDGVVRSSPCRPHHENFGRNLYHMFVPAYFASQSIVLFWVVVFELLQCQVLIPYLPQMVFSCSYVNTNPSWSSRLSCQFFPTGVISLQVDPIISTFARSTQVFSTVFVSFVSMLPLFFPAHPSLFPQGLRFLNQVSFDSQEDTNGASSLSFLVLLSSPVDSIKAFGVDHIPFSSFRIPSLASAPHIHSFLTIQLLGSAQDISKIRVFHSSFVQAFSRMFPHSSHLI